MSVEVIQLGCGTVNYWVACELARSTAFLKISRWWMVDHDIVEAKNATSCPNYVGHEGEPKATCLLGRITDEWLDSSSQEPTVWHAVQKKVEHLDWRTICGDSRVKAQRLVFIIQGLDDWSPRLVAFDDAAAVDWGNASVLTIVAGIDCNAGSVEVYSTTPFTTRSPCPACGRASFPESAPCVAYLPDGSLLRGDLQSEAREVASLIRQICMETEAAALLGGESPWTGTRTSLLIPESGETTRRTRNVSAMPDCLGRHADQDHVDQRGNE
jgi:hypothetical protein